MNFFLFISFELFIAICFAFIHYHRVQKSDSFSIARIFVVALCTMLLSLLFGYVLYASAQAYLILLLFFFWMPLVFISFTAAIFVEEVSKINVKS